MHETASERASGDNMVMHRMAVCSRQVSPPVRADEYENRVDGDESAIARPNVVRENALGNSDCQVLLAIGLVFKWKDIQGFLSASVWKARFPDDGASAKEYFKQHNIDTDLVELVALCSKVGIQRLSTAANRHLKSA